MQRVDLIVDGKTRNLGQRSDNAALQKRVTAAYQTARVTKVTRSSSLHPVPPPAPPSSAARSWLVLAENPLYALNAPLYYKLALTADLSYRDWYTDEFFEKAHAQGRVMAPWCDCRTDGSGTPPEVAFKMAEGFHLTPPLGQGESAAEGDNARAAGMKIVMGKIAEQSQATRETVEGGGMLWIEEDYWNCGAGPRDWHHEPVAGALCAVYRDKDCAGMPLDVWISSGRYVAHEDSMYGPGMTPADYAKLP